jgi:hypothetical protein
MFCKSVHHRRVKRTDPKALCIYEYKNCQQSRDYIQIYIHDSGYTDTDVAGIVRYYS